MGLGCGSFGFRVLGFRILLKVWSLRFNQGWGGLEVAGLGFRRLKNWNNRKSDEL